MAAQQVRSISVAFLVLILVADPLRVYFPSMTVTRPKAHWLTPVPPLHFSLSSAVILWSWARRWFRQSGAL
jgi:hypothetical protein